MHRERDQEEWGQQEWGQQEWAREEAWVRQEASQQSQADPARTHPDQGTVGWPEQVFPWWDGKRGPALCRGA